MRDAARLNNLWLIAACCLMGYVAAITLSSRGQLLPTNQQSGGGGRTSGGAVSLRYLECSGAVAVFILNNGSERPIYLRMQTVSDTSRRWKKVGARYGIYSAEYKAPKSDSFVDASMIQDDIPPLAIIPPDSSLRFGISLTKGAGMYRVHIPYVDDPSVAQLMAEPGKPSREDLDRMGKAWKEVSSEEANIRCK